MRVSFAGAVNPAFSAATVTCTLAPVMYEAAGGTSTDQRDSSGVAASLSWSVAAAEVAVSAVVPMVTVTDTPASVPVLPAIANPAAFSAMLTVLSPAIASRLSTRAPVDATVRSRVAVAAA